VPAVAGILYFAYHAVDGETGYATWVAVRAETVAVEAELAGTRARNAALEAQIEGLRPQTLDPDAVETALRRLGYVRGDEQIILAPAD